jgi:nitrogenase molybdenum-iron protein alpha/beta subunit
MTQRLCEDLTPDGFTGAIMAVEGIRDAAVLLNGPTGCKFYHGAISDGQLPRQASMDPLQFSENFYFGQPRVPATYLDNHDYIFGATQKLEEILPAVAEKGHRLIAVVNSPGAALIGDDLERFIAGAGLPVPCLAMESTGFSDCFSHGFQKAVIQVLQKMKTARLPQKKKRSVNLVGLSIFHRHWEGDAAELIRLLGLCGIEVNAVVCAGCTVQDIANCGAAEANVIIHEEFTDDLAPFIESTLDIPCLKPITGAPIGFSQTEKWVDGVCNVLHVDPTPALADLAKTRRRAYDAISRFNGLTGLPKGATFALGADGSLALSLSTWLYEYLGMVPVIISLQETTPSCESALKEMLKNASCTDAFNASMESHQPDLVFGNEGYISRFRAMGRPMGGVNIALPGNGDLEILPRCHLGGTGSLWLLEQILGEFITDC